jgi:hypothetical protein
MTGFCRFPVFWEAFYQVMHAIRAGSDLFTVPRVISRTKHEAMFSASKCLQWSTVKEVLLSYCPKILRTSLLTLRESSASKITMDSPALIVVLFQLLRCEIC